MTERKLVTIRTINALNPIPKADSIECAKIDGWNVVVKKGEFQVGNQCVFIEIDSVLPDTEPFKFLTEKQGKTFYNGMFGARLKTVRLRGQLSQGLALPFRAFPNSIMETLRTANNDTLCFRSIAVGGKESSYDEMSLADLLGIWKYDPPPAPGSEGLIAGPWPGWLQKTDQQRVQNIDPSELTGEYIMEEKMDGTSMSVWIDEHGTLGVGSRNMSLKIDDSANDGNMYVRMAHDSGMLTWLVSHILPQGAPFAIQGELCGPGIQGNPYKLDRVTFFAFDIFSKFANGKYNWDDRDTLIELMQLQGVRIKSVPLLGQIQLDNVMDDKVDEILKMAEGKSRFGDVEREGVVFKSSIDGNKSFKAISNQYLLSQKE